MTLHSALTPEQLAQAAYLFADDFFGTDPAAFDYELEGEQVIGRRVLASVKVSRERRVKAMEIQSQVEPRPSEEQVLQAGYAMDHLAQLMVEQIIQVPIHQQEEA